MTYGKFMTVIKKVDMFKNHLRLIVGRVDDKNDMHVLLTPTEAHKLMNNIYNELDTHRQYMRSECRKRWETTIAYDFKGKAIHVTR